MKKIVITSFLAILLSLSFYFIAIWEPDSYIGENVDKNLVLDENKNDKKETTDEINKKENIKEDNIEDKKNNSDSSQSLNLEDKSSNNILNEEEKNTGMQENDTNDNNKEGNDAVQSNASVFTVKKEEIIDKLSFKDKTKLLSVANKMSAVDVERIRESLEKSDEKEGAAEVFKVIKRRLTDEDYKQIKEILSPYINIKLLESMY
ncbi:hypothetical protein BH721_06115 [Clostridium baratii]|uniref:Uncharacterized protein n=1 Tax=Clostridium baratii TaxID=1561 RepID=A0A174TQQ7_9CLOT|nr:hypothetical protein [Clostridium baratii]OPF52825.1 hypothetical protein A1M12_12325 [Clostridium baratii]OPF56274.1 hypothetical protein BH721_06115 [Clostridium baratii]OPF58131.1 hypothetical protein BH724_04460 [Clostridium baratii]OPF59344.1 hypothetical protein BH725_01805 [Clostridium baratii]CUQ10347.1 Uncharacterised protein [Clostridium baratii]